MEITDKEMLDFVEENGLDIECDAPSSFSILYGALKVGKGNIRNAIDQAIRTKNSKLY